jgi:cell division transport system permease protein
MAINPGYFAMEALSSFRRNWVMSVVAVITIYLSLLLVGVFVISGMLVNTIVSSVEHKVNVTVFIKDGAAPGDVDALQAAFDQQHNPLISGVTYVSKEEALQRFKEQMKDSPEIIRQLDSNPLPASLEISLKDPKTVKQVVGQIKSDPNFMKVIGHTDDPEKDLRYGQQVIDKLFAFTRVIRIVESVFIVMLGVVSIVLIGNTIRLAIYSRRREIGIMRLVGASNWFIRTPFLLEGMLQSIIGAVLAILSLMALQVMVMPKIELVLQFLHLALSAAAMAQLAAILLVSGIVIGLVGSTISLTRYLRV